MKQTSERVKINGISPNPDQGSKYSRLQGIILPVLEGMPLSMMRSRILNAFSSNSLQFNTIESGFEAITSERHSRETLRTFFQSWSQTNNSAMTVAGIANRLTMMLHRGEKVADELALLRALTSLHRIVDEDLAVTHRILHSQLFHKMATTIVGDDDWLAHRYITPSAKTFRQWKDKQSLREVDPMTALLTTLVHEIYTHGEVEFILPLFQWWLERDFGFDTPQISQILGWIKVHCGPTEKNHFFHALDSIYHYSEAMGLSLEDYKLDPIVADYVEKKAAVMSTFKASSCQLPQAVRAS